MAGRNVTARFSVEADVAQAKRDLEGITQQVDQLGKTKVDNVRQELEQLTASTGKLAGGYTALTQEQRQAYQQREQDAQSVERLRRSYKTLEGALEAVDVQVQHGHRSAEDAVRIQGLLAQAYGRTNAVIGQSGQAFQGGVNATRAAIVAQESAAASTKRLNGAMQQAGWQVSDFANQMANGGNVATAAGMQLGQLLGSLGPMGAAIGAVVNVGGVLAGVLTKTGDEAEITATSFTSYTKALEFAKRASEEMKGASEGVRAALEAEGRAAVDAAQKRLTKAEAELKALETGIMSTPDAASAAGAALKYLWDAGKVKELRQEIEVLRGTLGQYNDGAREVRVSTEQGSGALKNARNAIEEYRESLRQQIDQTKLLADNEDLSNAGKLRARLETEALARAQAAGRTEIDAGTKALIKGLVAQQERIDSLEEEEKASKKAATAAETLEKARKKVTDDLDRDIAAQKRLAEVAGMSAAQQAEANVQTRIAAELAKAHTTASTEEGKAIAAKVKEAERWKRVAADEKLLKSAEDQLAYARQELALVGQSASVRDRALKSIQIERDAVKEWGDTTSAAAQQWIALQEQIADTQALTQYATEVKATSKEIASSISENLYDRLTDPSKATSAIDFFKSIFKRIAIAALENAIVLPIVTQIVGSMPSLFGVQAPAGAGGIAGAAQGLGGLLSNATNLVSLGRSGWSILSGGSGLAATQAAGSFATSGLGEALGLSTSAAGVIPEAAATDMMLTGSGNALVGAAGTIGAAMPYGIAGGFLGGLAGTAMNSKVGGALVGAAAGAGAAGLGASIWGMGAVGGPWGIAAAAIISAVMGMLGTQKKTVGPNSSGNLVLDGAGGFRTDQALADNGADASQMQSVTDSIAKAMNAVITGIGGKLTGGDGANTGLLQYFAKDNKWFVTPQVGDKAGQKSEFTDQSQAIQFYMRESLKGLIGNGSLTGVNDDVKTVLAKSNATTSEALTKHLQLAATFQDSVDAMNNAIGLEDAARKQGKTAAADLTTAIKDFRQTAADAGLDATKAAAATRNWIDTLVSGADPKTYTVYEAQAAQYRAQWSNMGDVLQAVGYSAADAAKKMDEGLNNSLKKLAKTLNTSLDQQINSALGRDYLNQITKALEDEQTNARDLAAVGEPITKAQALRAAQLDSVMKQLDATQLDVITSTYGANSDIGKLAQTIKALGIDATATAAFLSDVRSRMYAAVGDDRSSQLIALDAQQAKALADARVAGYDMTQLQQVQAVERAAKAFQLAQADVLGAYDAQITAQQGYITGLTNGAMKIAQSAAQFKQAFDALALNDNSPLSQLDRLKEARRQFTDAYATYKDTGATDDARDQAKQNLIALAPTLVQLAKGYYGSTDSTDYDWARSVLGEFADTKALGVDTAQKELETAENTLKEMQKARADAAALGQKQYGAISGLKDVMDQSYAVWQAALGPLQDLTGTTRTGPHYSAPANVQAAWDGLSSQQQFGIARAMGWGGTLDDAFNVWLGTSSSRAATFGTNVLAIGGGARYGAPEAVQSAWDRLTDAQRLAAVRAAGYDGGVDAGLNAWVQLGHQSAFEAAVRAQARAAGLPGYVLGGMVANGDWNRDSVLAMLAGGEHITRATSVNAETLPALDWINRTGRWPANDLNRGRAPAAGSAASNDNGAQLLTELRRQNALLERLIAVTEDGDSDNATATRETAAELRRALSSRAGRTEPVGSRLRTANG